MASKGRMRRQQGGKREVWGPGMAGTRRVRREGERWSEMGRAGERRRDRRGERVGKGDRSSEVGGSKGGRTGRA
jgi:hypothetical protein